jgi:hypothetical protein
MATDVRVNSSNVSYSSDHIVSTYDYNTVDVETKDGVVIAQPRTRRFKIRTERNVPKTGLMIVGLGGNNGTTLYAGEGLTWIIRSCFVSAGRFPLASIAQRVGKLSKSGFEYMRVR